MSLENKHNCANVAHCKICFVYAMVFSRLSFCVLLLVFFNCSACTGIPRHSNHGDMKDFKEFSF